MESQGCGGECGESLRRQNPEPGGVAESWEAGRRVRRRGTEPGTEPELVAGLSFSRIRVLGWAASLLAPDILAEESLQRCAWQ